eukprot:CAMPEP_0185724828 /NCGR_PEP_ID=MMETSP1171-20130828/1203_1 /TAXON_ID=374046 /ORGANISM="Helicotheca tamensis, Strain CCMP826" /LENGTH=391 /DNA_ID=CAMNT_0028392769 /DNA_START=112 /DNA_END=1287 /DNA_ORIENTATION=+
MNSSVPVPKKTKTTRIEQQSKLKLWNNDDIDSLPDADNVVPLEKTRISIDGTTPRKVMLSICRCLHDMSIAIIPKRNKLLAESLDSVQFYIRLYKEKFNTKYRVMVELQRKRGDSLSYCKIARVILHVLKHGDDFNGTLSIGCSLSIHQPKLKFVRFATVDSIDIESNIPENLHTAVNMLRDTHLDTNLNGMESLFFMTKEDSTMPPTNLYVAGVILQGGAGDSEYLKTEIEKSIRCKHSPGRDQEYEDDDDLLDGFEPQCRKTMHHYALAVLANSLHIWSKHNINMVPVIHSDKWLGHNGLLCALINELSRAEEHPHDAYQAMRCLNTLLRVSSQVWSRAVELGAPSAVISSRLVGRRGHALLAEESESAMMTLTGISSRSSLFSRLNSI